MGCAPFCRLTDTLESLPQPSQPSRDPQRDYALSLPTASALPVVGGDATLPTASPPPGPGTGGSGAEAMPLLPGQVLPTATDVTVSPATAAGGGGGGGEGSRLLPSPAPSPVANEAAVKADNIVVVPTNAPAFTASMAAAALSSAPSS
eukprot:RCo043731